MSVRSLCRCVASGRLDAKNIRRYSSKADSLDDLAEMELKMKAAIELQKKTIEAAETMGKTQGKDPWYLATVGAAGVNVLLAWRMMSEKTGHESEVKLLREQVETQTQDIQRLHELLESSNAQDEPDKSQALKKKRFGII